MNVRKLKKKLLVEDNEQLMYDYYIRTKLYNKSRRECVDKDRIIDDYFYVTTQYAIGYVNRNDYSCSLDRSRSYFSHANKGMLYAEECVDGKTNEFSVGYFNNFKSAVNWVGRYGCEDSDVVQYYYISKRYVYRIWNSTHLTGTACKLLF